MINFLIEKLSVLLVGDLSGSSARENQLIQMRDRRWAARLPLKIRVNLYSKGSLVRHGIVADFSLNGLFLRCHQADLRVGDELDLAIPDNCAATEKWYPMRVKISRIAEQGVAMEFCQYNCQSFCCINKLMHVQNEQKAVSKLQAGQSEHEAA
mgnify:CR=1 FL=1